MASTSYYATVRSDRDRELRSYEAQTEVWLKAKREGGMLPDFAGGMAASRQSNMFGGSGSRDLQSYNYFRQTVYQCFPAGTEIWTPGGMLPIEDIEIGDRVFTHAGRIAVVNNTGSRPSPDQLVTIRTNASGRIACTDEHPFLVRANCATEWKRADQLVVGDILLRPTIQLGEPVTETRIQVHNDRMHASDDRANYGQTIPLTPAAGYLLGIFLAEGHVRFHTGEAGRKIPKTTAFSLAVRYPELHDNVECAMAEVFGLACTTRCYNQGGVTLLFNGRIAAEWFLQCRHLAPNKRIPEFVYGAPEEFRRALLDGYLDGGDGCHWHRVVNFSTVSPSLMMGIVILAQQFGALFSNTRYEGGFVDFGTYVSPRLPGWHPYVCGANYVRLCEALGWKLNDTRGTTPRSKWKLGMSTAVVAEDGYGEFKIIEIGRSEPTSEHVYNLDVAEDHSYIAHGFAVHNCVHFISRRISGQPWSAGELQNAERDDKKPPKKSYELSLRQPWLKHTVAKGLLRRSAPGQDLDVFQSHAILDTIDRPNPLQRRSEFMYMSVASLLLTGVCYWVGGKVKGKKSPNDKKADGDKIELWAIPSHLVEPLHKDGLFSAYKIKMSAQDMSGQEIPAANVARTYIPDPSDIMGVLAPLNACIRAIRTDDHVQGSQEGLFARGLMPHVGITIGETATTQILPILGPDQRKQLERMIIELYNRTINDGRPAIFDGMVKDIKRLDPMPREMDWKVSGEIVRDRILRTFGISLLLLGDTQGGNRAQAVMAEENAAANVFNPLADTFTETACEWLAPMFEPENTTGRIWVWINPFKAHDEEMTQREWDSARKNGDVDRNEFRAGRLGLPPREDEIEKSQLVETVGGVQGAVTVLTAVGQGQVEPEQAQVIFREFYGLPDKVAKALAGEKKPQPPAPGPGAPGQPPFGVPATAEKPAEATAEPAPGKSVKYSEDQPRDEAGRFGEGSGGSTSGDEPAKRPAEARGEAVSARVEGSGKNKKVLLEDGSEAPDHIQQAGIPPAWKDVKVYTDPESEVWVEAKHTTQRGIESTKKIYNPTYEAEQQAAKHVRIENMMEADKQIKGQIKDGLRNPETKEEAAVALLMDKQATRPGSEKDTKGLAKYYDKPVKPDNVIVTPAKGSGKPKVELKVGKDKIHIRDEGTANELIKRKEAGEGLEDTTYWLKSHGATTLESRHVVEEDDGVHLKFVGKEGVFHDHVVKDKELADVIRERAKTANERDGKLFDTDDGKVQDYVKSLDTGRFTPKDFRTKRATELALDAVKQYAGKQPSDNKERQKWIMEVSSKAAGVLGNRPQQCFETYINPHVWDMIPKAAA